MQVQIQQDDHNEESKNALSIKSDNFSEFPDEQNPLTSKKSYNFLKLYHEYINYDSSFISAESDSLQSFDEFDEGSDIQGPNLPYIYKINQNQEVII